MTLTADQLVELLAAVAQKPASPGTNEQRTHVRIGLRYRICFAPLRGGSTRTGPTENAWIRDVSAGGMGLSVNREMQPGEGLVVQLPRASGAALAVVCTVCHCRLVAPEIYHVGVRFVAPWVEAEMQAHRERAPQDKPFALRR